jgi:hypothetical protein
MKSLNLNFSNNYTDRTDLVFNTKRFHHLNYLNNIIYILIIQIIGTL